MMTVMGKIRHQNELTMTEEEQETVDALAKRTSVTHVEVWRDWAGILNLSMTEDGLTMYAMFDENGCIIGDWIV